MVTSWHSRRSTTESPDGLRIAGRRWDVTTPPRQHKTTWFIHVDHKGKEAENVESARFKPIELGTRWRRRGGQEQAKDRKSGYTIITDGDSAGYNLAGVHVKRSTGRTLHGPWQVLAFNLVSPTV